jgi:hypothetical protein
MNTLSVGGRKKLMIVELVAKVALAFGIGLATSIALAGIVLLLSQNAQATAMLPDGATLAIAGVR